MQIRAHRITESSCINTCNTWVLTENSPYGLNQGGNFHCTELVLNLLHPWTGLRVDHQLIFFILYVSAPIVSWPQYFCRNGLPQFMLHKIIFWMSIFVTMNANPSIYCFHLVISSLSTLNQLSIHRATFLTTSWLQMVVLIWRGERGGPETSRNIWTSGSDTPSHLAPFHPLRSRSRAQALLRSRKPSSHTPTQPPSDTDGSWARGKGCVWLLSQDIDMIWPAAGVFKLGVEECLGVCRKLERKF